jgi:cystathionine beta-lyase
MADVIKMQKNINESLYHHYSCSCLSAPCFFKPASYYFISLGPGLKLTTMRSNFDETVDREGTDCIKYDLRESVFGRRELIPMWVADMDFKTPDFIYENLHARLDHRVYGYSYRPAAYCDSIVWWLARKHNWQVDPEWILFCPGVVPAINISTLVFTRPGDHVAIQPPVYTPFFNAVEAHGRNLLLNKLTEDDGRYIMDIKSLRKELPDNTRMIILSNPHNPVGRAWNPDELKELADLCLEKQILILSDEIHSDLILPGYKHTPVASLSPEIADITVTCIAPSKTFNLAGLSTSSVIISNPVLRKYFSKKTGSLHIENGNIFGNTASMAAYSEKGYEWVAELMEYISSNVSFVTDYCRSLIPEIVPVKPESTYLIWLDCRALSMKGEKLERFFVEKAGVGLSEGSRFGPGGDGFMRMNLGAPLKTVVRAMEQIEKAVSEWRKK